MPTVAEQEPWGNDPEIRVSCSSYLHSEQLCRLYQGWASLPYIEAQ